ncbi:248_t:CDS:2 [Acaulospora morrowiae]|uniref:Maintenance of mitochondrial morphology protein 1 n=1 Tax=Acaulospora morrowiae TaxID=94023 RepID=A0A9N9CFD7_9GLOM|nr:248_t:CDS:2 [Acaulospora morrowiae]
MSLEETISPELQQYIDQVVSKLSGNSWSFLQGFFLGQLTIVFLVLAFVKFMLLEEVQKKQKRPLPLPTQSPLKSQAANSSPASVILSKTLYDPKYHPPESTDWLNVLLAQAINQYREDAKADNRLVRFVDRILNEGVKPNFVGTIEVTKLDIGEEYPIFNNARIRSTETIDRMRVEVDCEFNDQISLGIDTQIIINWPKPRIAVLPISLVLSVVKFSATMALEIETSSDSTFIAVSALPDFILEFGVQSLIGSRSKLEGVPKITHMVTSKLRNMFCENFVYPNSKKIKIPSLWETETYKNNIAISEDASKSENGLDGINNHISHDDNENNPEGQDAYEQEHLIVKEKSTSSALNGLRKRNSVISDYPLVQDDIFFGHGIKS